MSYPRDFYFQASSGEISGLTSTNKFGSNPDIDIASVPETVWSPGGLYVFPTSSGSIEVLSTSPADTAAGTGARTITIEGLNDEYEKITETFTLDGGNPVSSSLWTNWFRVYRAFVATAGLQEKNAGEINIRLGATTLATIPPEEGQTQMAIFSIPADKKGYVTSITGSILKTGPNRSADIALYQKVNGVIRKMYEFNIETTGSTTFTQNFKTPIQFNEKTDIYINVTNVSANSTAVFASFNVIVQ